MCFNTSSVKLTTEYFFTLRFTFVKEYLIEFNQLAMANASGADDMLNRVMTKDNIGIAALLELKDGYLNYSNDMNMPRQQVLVSNVHIHWDPEFKDVKLIQTVMLMHELMNIMQEINPGFMVQGGKTTPSRASCQCHHVFTPEILACSLQHWIQQFLRRVVN